MAAAPPRPFANRAPSVISEVPSRAAAPPGVDIRHVTKTFTRANGEVIRPLDDISLSVAEGEIVVLLGPSGCGKTTLLRCVAGLERPGAGEIRIRDRTVFSSDSKQNVPPEGRELGMIFQSYALWPHLTVAQNVGYPLRYLREKPSRDQVRSRVRAVLATMNLTDVAGQHPGQLSGGQQQRTALARALVAESDLILFDEPLSNVDAKVREELRLELLELQRRIRFTAIYVTHDQVEAMGLADRIAVLRSGSIEQFDSPRSIYLRPRNRYVAHFIGSANDVPGTVTDVSDGRLRVTTPIGQLVGVPGAGQRFVRGDRVHALWRPEHTELVAGVGAGVDGGSLGLRATLLVSRFFGVMTDIVCVAPDGTELRSTTTLPTTLAEGEDVVVSVPPEHLLVFSDDEDRPGPPATGGEDA